MLAGLSLGESLLFLVLLPVASICFLSLDADFCLFSMGLEQSTFIGLFGLTILIAAAFYNVIEVKYGPPVGRSRATNGTPVPFILLSGTSEQDYQTMFRSVHKSLETYRAETHGSLETLSRALDVARDHSTVASHLIRSKIERLSTIFNEDMETLEAILCAEQLRLTRVLPSAPTESTQPQEPANNGRNSSTDFVWNLGAQGTGLSHIPLSLIHI